MITKYPGSEERATPYNEIVALYIQLLGETLSENSVDKSIIMPKNGSVKDVDRAPLILIKRGLVKNDPNTVMLSEQLKGSPFGDFVTSGHILNYDIIFESFGNTYAEAEKIGNLVLETILSSGQTVVASLNDSVTGSRLNYWSESKQVESKESMYVNELSVSVFAIVGGQHKLN